MSKFDDFACLHIPGEPVVLFNAWDAGSAAAVAKSGAKAIATGSASVSMANGYGDAEEVPLDFALANAARIVRAVELPVTIDFEGGYASGGKQLTANGQRLAETGAIGCNFEDQVVGGEGLHPLKAQAARIASIRAAIGADFFINARTDLVLKAGSEAREVIDEVIERGQAFADAGASGFFVPRLADPRLVERVVREVPLPLNLIAFPDAPPARQWADAGAARISHGPFPHRALMQHLVTMARAALDLR